MKDFNEKTLVHKLEKILRKKFFTDASFKEFSAGYGIADLVFAPNFSFKKNTVKRSPITNFYILSLLLTLQANKKYALEDICNEFNLPAFETNKYISFLKKNEYIQQIDKKYYMKSLTEHELNPIKKIIAIEAKLYDHKNGLIQARRYQYFADESYLAILKRAERNIDIDEFNKYNIGLILFDDKTGEVEIKHPQNTNEIFEYNVSFFAKEQMINKFISLSF